MIVVGIDPGAGVKSATGVAVVDMETYEILMTRDIWPKNRKARAPYRIMSIAIQVDEILVELPSRFLLVNEHFVMRGKGGETLQRLVGAIYATAYTDTEFLEASNMQLKQFLSESGSGKATKEDVALGVKRWFAAKNKIKEVQLIDKLIGEKKWDSLDALAVAIVGYLVWTD